MQELKQSTQIIVSILMLDSTNGVEGKTGLTLSLTLKKQGESSFSSISPTQTDVGNGWYDITLTTTHTNTVGSLILHASATGANPADEKFQVKAAITDDVYSRIGAPVGVSISADIAAVDTVADAIQAKTDNLPSDPADASVVAGLIAAAEAKIDTVDTVVDAIKVKTDSLPSSPAAMVFKKGVQQTISFYLYDSDGNLKTGATGLAVTVSKDSGAFAASTNSPSEVGGGKYEIVLTSTEKNAARVDLKCTATSCRVTPKTIYTEE